MDKKQAYEKKVRGGLMKETLAAVAALAVPEVLALDRWGDDGDKKVTAEQAKKEAKEAMVTVVAYTKQKQEELMAKTRDHSIGNSWNRAPR